MEAFFTSDVDLTQHGVKITAHALIRYLQRVKGVEIDHVGFKAMLARNKLNVSAIEREIVADLRNGGGRTVTKMKPCGKVKAYGASNALYYTERKKVGDPLKITTVYFDESHRA